MVVDAGRRRARWVDAGVMIAVLGTRGEGQALRGPGASSESRCVSSSKDAVQLLPHWLQPDQSWCETGCGVVEGRECFEAACCERRDPAAPPPPLPPSPPAMPSGPAAAPCGPLAGHGSGSAWKCTEWASNLPDTSWCGSGCGVTQGWQCCERTCCNTAPQPAQPEGQCVPFDLKTRHLVVISDTTAHARRQLVAGQAPSLITLQAGSATTVGCESGYRPPANLGYLNGLDTLNCTSGDSGGIATTRLTCEPLLSNGHGGSTTEGGSHSTTGDNPHAGVVVMTLAAFCAAAFATVIGKRKQQERGLQSGSRRRKSMAELVSGGATSENQLELGLMGEGVPGPEQMKSHDSGLCPYELPGNPPEVNVEFEWGHEVLVQTLSGPPPVKREFVGEGQLESTWYGAPFVPTESPSGDEASEVSDIFPWEFETSEFMTASDEPFSDSAEDSDFAVQSATQDLLGARDLTETEIGSLPLPPRVYAPVEKVNPVVYRDERKSTPLGSFVTDTVQKPVHSESEARVDRGGSDGSIPQPARAARAQQSEHACQVIGCAYQGPTRAHLTRHMRSHTGYRPFVCSKPGCGYAASQKEHLATHMLKHSDVKPFKCAVCGFATKRKEHLTRHMRRHTQDEQ